MINKSTAFSDYLRLIRFPNLLIVALTQYLLQYALLVPAFRFNGLRPALDLFHFSLLVLSTVLIAASGYVVNDLIDYPIDLINKPHQLLINRRISISHGWRYYYTLVLSGFFLSLYLAWYVHNLPLVVIYPVAVTLLYWYSRSLKARVLWGNIIVSIFCAFVAGIVLFAERDTVKELFIMDFGYAYETVILFLDYLLFAFLSTMLREIIKDMEDIFGDQQLEYRTLPIAWGMKAAKLVAFFFGFLLLVFLIYAGYLLWQRSLWILVLYLLVAVLFPLAYVLYSLKNAESQQDFHNLSQLCKYIMLSGLLGLLLVGWASF